MKPCKILLLGCGHFGKQRIQAANELSDLEIVGVYDTKLEAAKQGAQLCKAPALEHFEDIDELDYDAVILSTSNDSHLNLCLYFAGKNKYVLCESPLVKTIDQLDILRNLDHQQLGLISPANPIRHNPLVMELQKLLQENTIGKIFVVKISLGCNAQENRVCWKSNHAIAGGGALLEMGPTIIGLSQVFGNIKKFTVQTKTFNPSSGIDDYAYGHFELDNDILIHFEADWNKWNNHESIIVEGERGILKVPLHSDKIILTDKYGETVKIKPQTDHNQLVSELDVFSEKIHTGSSFFIDISEQIYYLPTILRKAS
jgi:predicted dehydrogenase